MFQNIINYFYEFIFGKPEEPKFGKPDGYKNINSSSTIKN